MQNRPKFTIPQWPYWTLILLGLAITSLCVIAFPHAGWHGTLPLIVISVGFIAAGANRILYLGQFKNLLESEPESLQVEVAVSFFGAPVFVIPGHGSFIMDKWHSAWSAEFAGRLEKNVNASALVYFWPVTREPAIVSIDGNLMLLEGRARTYVLCESDTEQGQKLNSVIRRSGQAGSWMLLFYLIPVLWLGMLAFLYLQNNDTANAASALLVVPAFYLYFLPFIVAYHTQSNYTSYIFCLNLILIMLNGTGNPYMLPVVWFAVSAVVCVSAFKARRARSQIPGPGKKKHD